MRRLVGFARVNVEAGQSEQVQVPIVTQALATTPGDIQSFAPPRVRPGDYRLAVGDESVGLRITR